MIDKFLNRNIVIFVILLIFFVIAILLRTYILPDHLLFGFEQGRDALLVREMMQTHKLTLLGPKTDIDGIFHGPGYYYVLLILYMLGNWNPGIVILYFAVIGSSIVFITYLIAHELIKDRKFALMAALMSAISFDLIIYSRWLSNVSPSIPVIGLFFYSLIKVIKTKKTMYWIPVGLFLGALSHFEILHVLYALFLILATIYVFKLPIKNRFFLIGTGVFVLLNSTFILFDLRHQFLLTHGIIHYLTSQSLSTDPLLVILQFVSGFINTMVVSLFPSNGLVIFALMIFLLVITFRQKNNMDESFKILLLFLFFTIPYVFLLKYSYLEHFYAGSSIIWIVLLNYLLYKNQKRLKKAGVISIYVLLLFGITTFATHGLLTKRMIFYHTVQSSMIYRDQLATIDYIFQSSDGPFSFEAFSIPYYHGEAWQYLYNWYGKMQYPQQYLINGQDVPKQTKYVIIEPATHGSILKAWLKVQDRTSTTSATVKIGDIEIQKRTILKQ